MQLQLKNNQKYTSVPNGFIERCIGAPEKYIAAYLLGLMYSQRGQNVDLGIFCARLGMSEGEAIGAFEYWQKKGFVRIVNSDQVRIEFGTFIEDSPVHDVYTEKEYNRQIQAIFGARQLSPHEYIKIYDYIDIFGLTRPVVLILLKYCVMLRGKLVSISYIDKVAKSGLVLYGEAALSTLRGLLPKTRPDRRRLIHEVIDAIEQLPNVTRQNM